MFASGNQSAAIKTKRAVTNSWAGAADRRRNSYIADGGH
jgi:hypothetical protein